MCDAAEPWQHGVVFRTPSSPEFWDGNFVRVDDEIDARARHTAADELLAEHRHRKLDVVDEHVGAAARPYFAALGWMHERLAMMRRSGSPPAPPGHAVREVPVAATRELRAEWYTEFEGDYEEQMRFAESQEPILARRGIRAFMVGEAGFTTLAAGAEIDQLYVTPDARGGGIGAGLLAAALRAGDSEVCWVVADDEGRARALYERLGFQTVWTPYSFVKMP
jgi:GNAT superfamily N-acetyltransferase